MKGTQANARIRAEQDVNLVLKSLKLKISGQPHDEVLLTSEKQYKRYKTNEDRITLEDGLLFRKNYGETGSVKNYQNVIPKQKVDEVLRSLRGEFGKHPGITKTKIASRQNYYHPNMAQLIKECLRLQNPKEHITAPEDAMQTDLVAESAPFGASEKIVTAMDVFSR